MNIFGFRPFKGRFNLGNSDDIPTNEDGTLIGAIKQINTHLTASNDAPFRFAYNSSTQEYGYIIDVGGADTFIPFKSGGANIAISKKKHSSSSPVIYNRAGLIGVAVCLINTFYNGVYIAKYSSNTLIAEYDPADYLGLTASANSFTITNTAYDSYMYVIEVYE